MIGIFDSGIGGLSILQQVSRLLPRSSIIYLADQANAPYGDKTPAFLKRTALSAINFLENKGARLIIIACNTATLGADINTLRAHTSIPLVGVEPPVKPLAKYTRTGHAAIFCTHATANSLWLRRAIADHASAINLKVIPAPAWVSFVESLEYTLTPTRQTVDKYLNLLHPKTDIIGLGCTHFSFLTPVITAALAENVSIIDTAASVARQAKSIYPTTLLSQSSARQFFTTSEKAKLSRPLRVLLGTATPVELVTL